MVIRSHMKTMLENLFFQVITVAHGEEALAILENHTDVSLIITEYQMPVMNGLDLTFAIRKAYTKDDLSIIALSENQDDEISALFLKNGANDYIKKPFSKEEFSCRINNSIEALENLHLVTNHANRDFLTGLYNRRYFFLHMSEYIDTSIEKYAVAMLNIDNFKKINDTYGYEVGDKVIIHLSEILSSRTNYRDMVSRFGGEEFCIVLKNVNRFSAQDILERLREEVEKSYIMINTSKEIRFTISIGFAMNSEDSLEDTIDQADMRLHKAKQEGKNRVISL